MSERASQRSVAPSKRRAAMDRGTLVLLSLLALGPALVYSIVARPAGERAAPYIALHIACSLAQLILGLRVARSSPTETFFDNKTHIQVFTIAAIFARLILVPCRPFTTTDVGRYLWDGAVVLAGRDPFALAPDAPALASLRETWPLPADHHDVVGCYPPLAQALFALCALFGPARAWLAWKTLVAVASALSARALLVACRDRSSLALATLWLFHPLSLFEAGVGAHLDALTGALSLWAILRAERGQWTHAAVALGAAVSLKLTPVVLCVALWPRARSRWRWPLECAALPVLTIAVPWALGAALPGSLPLVAQHWSFGAPLWTALYSRWPTRDALIRPALAAVGAALVLAQWLRSSASHATVARDASLGYAITNPTLYPWYLLPTLACGARASPPSPAATAFLWALATVTPLSYEVIDRYAAQGVWAPARWPLWSTAFAPPLAASLALLYRLVRRGSLRSQP